METRLCNTYKIANAITVPKNILESPYKALQDSRKGIIFKRLVQFSKAVQF